MFLILESLHPFRASSIHIHNTLGVVLPPFQPADQALVAKANWRCRPILSGFFSNLKNQGNLKNQFSLQKMYLTKEEEPNDSPSEEIMEEQETTVFDPKSFLESLFNSRQAEIEVLLHNNASYNQNITRYSNFVTI